MTADSLPHELSGVLRWQRQGQGVFFPVAAEVMLDSLGRQPSNSSLFRKLLAIEREVGIWHPSPSLLFTDTLQTGWGVHLQDLTAVATWTSQCYGDKGNSTSFKWERL